MTTYEELLQEMLNRVTNDVDKREGSLIYDALAPCAFALTEAGFTLENYLDLLLPDTSTGDYLDRAVWPFVERKQATAAVRLLTTNAEVELGSRWSIQTLAYTVTKDLGGNTYEATCETVGEVGNQYSGSCQALNAEYSSVTATLGNIITAGTDTEKDDALRSRFLLLIQNPATSGNANHYRQWALEVAGVGAAKVFPLDNGAGTVTVLVVDDDYDVDSSLINTVKAHIEEERPIGASVTVGVPTTKSVNVTATVELDGTRTLSQVKADFTAAFTEYLKNLISSNYSRGREYATESYRVSLGQVGNILIDTDGVEDYSELIINPDGGNVTIPAKYIPKVGTISIWEET